MLTTLLLALVLQAEGSAARKVFSDPGAPNNEPAPKAAESDKPDCATMCKVMAKQCEESCKAMKQAGNDRDCRVACKATTDPCAENCLKAQAQQKKR